MRQAQSASARCSPRLPHDGISRSKERLHFSEINEETMKSLYKKRRAIVRKKEDEGLFFGQEIVAKIIERPGLATIAPTQDPLRTEAGCITIDVPRGVLMENILHLFEHDDTLITRLVCPRYWHVGKHYQMVRCTEIPAGQHVLRLPLPVDEFRTHEEVGEIFPHIGLVLLALLCCQRQEIPDPLRGSAVLCKDGVDEINSTALLVYWIQAPSGAAVLIIEESCEETDGVLFCTEVPS